MGGSKWYAAAKLVASSIGFTEDSVKTFRFVRNFVREGSGYTLNHTVRVKAYSTFFYFELPQAGPDV
jgi:hypothetical protein